MMKPNINIYHTDCLLAMKSMKDKCYDLAIVDPPFGLKDTKKNKFRRNKDSYGYTNDSIPAPEYFRELNRVSKRSIIWGCQYMQGYLSPNGSFIIWNKKADPDKHNMSSCDVAWYSERKRIRIFHGAWCGAVKCENEPTIHIHQKPVALYKWLLDKYAQPGWKILDTHAGSCSLAIACDEYGYDLDAYEINETHYNNAVQRFERYKAQLSLFA